MTGLSTIQIMPQIRPCVFVCNIKVPEFAMQLLGGNGRNEP